MAKPAAPSIEAAAGRIARCRALEDVCHSLALQIVADGEGAQRVIEIVVRGAKTEAGARQIAQTIATSPLVKTAFRRRRPTGARLRAAGRAGVLSTPRSGLTMAGIHVLSAASRSTSTSAPPAIAARRPRPDCDGPARRP